MSVYADLLAQKKTFTENSPLGSYLASKIANSVDPASPAESLVQDHVDTITQDATDHTGGDFTLTVLLRSGETFTTGAIAFNAIASAIEGAIDTAATGVVTGWTNGDISASGGDLQTADVVLTFDGASVAGQAHSQTTMVDSRTGGVSPSPTTVQTTKGQTARPGWAFLIAMGIVTVPIPDQDAAVSPTAVTAGPDLTRVPATIVSAVVKEAAFEDANNPNYFSVMAGIGYENDRAPRVEEIGNATEL